MPSGELPSAKISAVVFDLGGVLIDWNPRHLYRKLFDDPARMEWFLAEVCNGPWNLRQDAGRPFAEAVAELCGQWPDHAPHIRAFHERWDEMLGDAIDGTVAVLEELAARGVTLHALTNWSAETFPVGRQRFPFLQRFGTIVVSGEIGLIKPDPAIYQHLLRLTGLRATDCVFIDDNATNAAAAAQLGFTGLHFTGPEVLRRDLVRLGLLT